MVIAQKDRAFELFSKDAKVQIALKTHESRGYKFLSSDAIPYQFAYGDEGPITYFLVTAWLGKSETYGWSPAFVMAKVSTDAFGPPAVTLVDVAGVERFLR